MTVYKEKSAGIGKFVIALIVFILGMTLTFSDALGVNYSSKNPSDLNNQTTTGSGNNQNDPNNSARMEDSYADEGLTTEQPKLVEDNFSVPEPGTLLLLSSGLGLLYYQRKRRNKKH